MNKKVIEQKLGPISSELLAQKGFISYTDIFIKLGYLDKTDVERWRMKKVSYLEKVIKTNLGKISFIMKTVRKNSINGKLKKSYTCYKSWGKGKKTLLRFSKTGNNSIEQEYSTHYLWNKNLEKMKSTPENVKHMKRNGLSAIEQ